MIIGYCQLKKIKETPHSLIYQGVRQQDNFPVIIKLIKPDHLYPQIKNSYQQEYQILMDLDHSGIIKAYDFVHQDNRLAIILEDFGGRSLSSLISETAFSVTEVLSISLKIVDALAQIHNANIIHKDINPRNILYNQATKELKLIDFGIAIQLPKEQKSIQNYKTLEGTLAYISPEQTGKMNRGLDYRSDYYSLGVTLYELLTQQLLFETQEPRSLIYAHLAKNPRSPTEIKPEIPQVVSDIVMKLIAKNAEDRYQSAVGLIYDLEICLNQLNTRDEIKAFELGKQDRCDRFLIPDKLYSREIEVKTLLDSFDRVAKGKSEMMLVAGYSGTGKTKLVNQVQKSIIRQKGYFIKGKFDQFNRSTPLSSFVQAFSSLIQQLLSETDAELTQWKASILNALGNNAQVVIEVIPSLEIILGKQPEVPELSGSAAQNRFNLVFNKFIRVFTKQEHPLVIFLDDLQWADAASLGLLKLLISNSANNDNSLLVIGAYRDNEVFPAHPLMVCLSEIELEKSSINVINLNPLSKSDINQLVSDSLLCSELVARTLSELIYQKTQGNPFFTTQFLKGLYEDNYIEFSRDENCWQCDLSQLKEVVLSDDALEYMTTRLHKLPETTKEVLKIAACISNSFYVATLVIVCKKSELAITDDLWSALQVGLIVPETQIYRLSPEDEIANTSEESSIEYRFLHDRVQQAAYALIPQAEKAKTHYQIGKLLNQDSSPENRNANIFDIVNQLNLGQALISRQPERDQLAQLNLIAGTKAKNAIAYQASFDYAQIGFSLLGDNSWDRDYQLTLNLHNLATESAYLKGDFSVMESLVNTINQNTKNILDTVLAVQTQIQFYATQQNYSSAISTGREILQELGIYFPERPSFEQVKQEYSRFQPCVNQFSIQQIKELPLLKDPEKLAAANILLALNASALISDTNLGWLISLKLVKLSLEHGNSPYSAHGYVTYGILVNLIEQDIEKYYQFGQLSLHVVDIFPRSLTKSSIFQIVGAYTSYLKSHFREARPLLSAAYINGLESGDFEFGGYSVSSKCQNLFFSGEPLTTVQTECIQGDRALEQLNNQFAIGLNRFLKQLVAKLTGQLEQPNSLASDCFSLEEINESLTAATDRFSLQNGYLYEATLQYLFLNTNLALANIQESAKNLDSVSGWLTEYIHYFYESLIYLDYINFANPSKENLVNQYLAKIENNQKKYQVWALHAPMNFQHKFDLVEAEKYRVLGNKFAALELYDKAIAGAKENQFIQEEALANELAAKFYLDWGKEKIAAVYLQEAHSCYEKWGAQAKTNQLEKQYPELLFSILQEQNQAVHPLQALSTLSTYINDNQLATEFDLQNRIRSAQTITETLELEELIRKISEVFLRHSGGDCIIIALANETGELEICAKGNTNNLKVNCNRLEANSDNPIKLINYVKNTQTKILVNNTARDLPIVDDYITQEQPQSILALPLIQKDQLIGILYLHSSHINNLFNSEKIVVLEFFCSQAAIALENARLYREKQEAEVELIHKNAFLQAQLESSLEGILVINAKREIVAYNQRFISIWNIPEAVLTTKDARQFLDFVLDQVLDPQEFLDKADYCLNNREKTLCDEIALKGQRFLERYSSPVTLPSGEYDSTILYFRDISDRKRSEQQLNELSERLELVLDSAHIGIWEWDFQQERLTWDERMLEIYGVSAEDFQGTYQDWSKRVHPEDLAKAEEEKTYDFDTQSDHPFTQEFRIVCPNGTIRYILATGLIQRNSEGQAIRTVGMNLDLSDRKVTELALKDSQDQFRRVAENFPGVMYRYVLHPDGSDEFTYISSQLEKLFEVPLEDALKSTSAIWEIIHSEDIPRIQNEVQKSATTQQPLLVEYRLNLPLNGLRWVQLISQPEPLANGDILWDGVIIDITDRKMAALSLQQSEEKFRTLVSNLHGAVYRSQNDTAWTMDYISDAIFDLSGYLASDFIESNVRSYASIIHPEDIDYVYESVNKAVAKQESFVLSYRVTHRNGSIRWVYEKGKGIFNQNNQFQYLEGVIFDVSDRKKAEFALKESQEQFLRMTENVPGMIHRYVLHPDGCDEMTYVDSQVREIFEVEPEVAIQDVNFLWERVHADDISTIKAKLKTSAKTLQPTIIEFRLILPQKGMRWIQISARPEILNNGDVMWDGVAFDISDRKLAESKQRRQLTILESTSDFIGTADPNGKVLYLNHAWRKLLAPDQTQLEQKTSISELYPVWAIEILLNEALPIAEQEGMWAGETAILDSNKLEIPVSQVIIAHYSPDHELEYYSTIVRDISNQKCYEQEILESKAFLQTVLDTFPLSIFWKDCQSRYIGVNQNFAKDAGFENPKDIIGLTDFDMPWAETEAHTYRADDRKVMMSDSTKLGIIETQFQADGTQIWIETNKLPLHDFAGNVIGVMGTYQDISDRKKAELQLKQTNQKLARATRMKDEFLANMSHELRTPLNAILGMSEGLQDNILGEVNEKQLAALRMIEKSGLHLLELINDILDLAKIESGHLELSYTHSNVFHICQSSLAFVKQQAYNKGIQLHQNTLSNLPNILLDEKRIRQVLINLLSNAVKFTPEGGKVYLEVSVLTSDDAKEQNYLKFIVKDTGIGISPEKLNTLFQSFIQVDSALNRQYEGTGLGLALVKRIVELHMGQVAVTSEVGVGSCFTFTLPYSTEAKSSLPQSLTDTKVSVGVSTVETNVLESDTILLAEDNEANISTLSSYLGAHGYKIKVAKNGRAAIEKALIEVPKLIIMDIQMPEIDGLEAIQQIRQIPQLAEVPIIALTALAMKGDLELCLEAGANLYLSKPVKLKKLTLSIKQLLGQS